MSDILETLERKFGDYHDDVVKRLDASRTETAALAERLEQFETKIARPGAFAGAAGSGNQYFAPEHHRHEIAFKTWLRNPLDRRATAALIEAEHAAIGPSEVRLTSGLTGADGGHAVPAVVVADLERRVTSISPLRQLARVVNARSTATKFPLDRAGTGSGWAGESATRLATAEPTFDLRTPTYGHVYALMSATEEILMDADLDIGAWLFESASTALAAAEGLAFVSGNGTARPTGFLSGPTPVVTADATRASGTLQYSPGGAAAAISSVDGLTSLFFSLKAQHRQNGTWLMNSATAAAIALLKDSTGRALWTPSLSEGVPPMLLGRPVAFSEDMPAVAANAFPVAFGDFRAGYLIVDQGGLRVTLDDNLTTPGVVRWYIRRRVGGVILNSEAIKLLRVSTT